MKALVFECLEAGRRDSYGVIAGLEQIEAIEMPPVRDEVERMEPVALAVSVICAPATPSLAGSVTRPERTAVSFWANSGQASTQTAMIPDHDF